MIALPPLVTAIFYLAIFLLVGAALGYRLLKWMRIQIPETPMHGIAAAGLGTGALQILPFALFATGIGQPHMVRAATIALAVLLIPDIRTVILAAWRWATPPLNIAAWEKFFLVVVSLFLVSMFVRTACPVTEIDSLLYHLTVSFRFLDAGRFLHLVTLTPTNWPLGAQMLHSIILAFNTEAPVAIVSFAYGVLTLAAVYFYGIHVSGRIFGAAAATVVLAHNVLWNETSAALVDVPLTAFATLAIIMLDRSYREPSSDSSWRLLSAIFAGLAATVKLQGVWVVLSLLTVIVVIESGVPPVVRLKRMLRYGAIAVALVMPWYVKTWILTGNPVYPMLYGVFGGNEWTPGGWVRYAENFILGENPMFLPSTPDIAYWSYVGRCVFSLVLAYSVFRFARNSHWRVTIIYAAMFHVFIAFGSALNARLLLPGFPAFGFWLAGVLTAWRYYPKILSSWRYYPEILLCISVCFWTAFVSLEKSPLNLIDATKVAIGSVTREKYLQGKLIEYNIVEYANRHLPPESRLLVSLLRINTAMFRFPAFWATYWEQDSFHYDSPERLRSDLRRLGVTHIVLATEFTSRCKQWPNCRKRLEVEFPIVTQVAKEDGTLLFTDQGIALYSLGKSVTLTNRRTSSSQ